MRRRPFRTSHARTGATEKRVVQDNPKQTKEKKKTKGETPHNTTQQRNTTTKTEKTDILIPQVWSVEQKVCIRFDWEALQPDCRCCRICCATQTRADAAMGERALTLFEYAAKLPRELSFGKNELLTVTDKRPSGWWIGTDARGVKGLFPR